MNLFSFSSFFPSRGGLGALEREKSKFFEESEIFLARLLLVSLHSFLSLSLSLSQHITMSTRAQTITKGRTLPPNARRVCSKALFAARGGARTPLRATETRALLRARYFFFFLAFSRGGDDDDDDDEGPTKPKTKISAKEKRREFFFLKERERKDTGLYKKRRTLFFRAVLFE